MLATRNLGEIIAPRGKRRWFGITVVILLITALGSLFDEADGAPFRVAAHRWLGYETLFHARERGWLDERFVRLIETPSASDSLRAFQQGRIDAAALTLDEAVRLAFSSGEEMTIVLIFDFSAGADVALARQPLREWKELKGKRIGVETLGVGYLMLAHLLRQAGLRADEVVIEPVTIDLHESAWEAGRVDALISYEPVSRRIEALGGKRLFDSRFLDDQIVDVLVVRTSILGGPRKKAVKALIDAHFRVLAEIRRNPVDMYHRLGARLGLTADETEHAYRLLRLPDAAANRRLLTSPPTPPLADTAAKVVATLALFGKVPSSVPPPNLRYSAAFLP